MRISLAHLVYYLLVFVLQVLLTNLVDTGLWVTLTLLPLIVIGFPATWDIRITMPVGFVLGLTADLATGGVPGTSAAACVALAALREPLYRGIVSPDGQNPAWTPSVRTLGIWTYLKFALAVYALYMLVFVLLDGFTLTPILFILARTALSTLAGVALAALLSLFIPERS